MSGQRREQRVLDAGEGRGRTLPCLQALTLQIFSPAEGQAGLGKVDTSTRGLPRGSLVAWDCSLRAVCPVGSPAPCLCPTRMQQLAELAAAADAGKRRSLSCSLPLPSPMSAGTFVRLKPHVCHQRSTPRGRAASPSLPVSREEKKPRWRWVVRGHPVVPAVMATLGG